jgi:TolB-like protein
MRFSINFSCKPIVCLFSLLVCSWACTATKESVPGVTNDSAVLEQSFEIAVLPISNQSSTPAPLRDMKRLLTESFKKQGLKILDDMALEASLIKHRIRYVAGIDTATARELKWETGAGAILITVLELYSQELPPKIALASRLVSTGSDPRILWIDGIGLAGDDSIGILELSLIEDPQKLLNKAVQHLSLSLAEYLSAEKPRISRQAASIRFWPQIFYRSPVLDSQTKYTLAILPFFNASETPRAGEFIALQFVRQLRAFERFSLLEPGIVREALLNYRIIMDDGLSNAQAELLFDKLNVDLILTGKIFDYQDYRGPLGTPKVDFSSMLLERKSQEVVWSCESHHVGNDGVFFFDWGKINTAHRMASEMVASALATLLEQD